MRLSQLIINSGRSGVKIFTTLFLLMSIFSESAYGQSAGGQSMDQNTTTTVIIIGSFLIITILALLASIYWLYSLSAILTPKGEAAVKAPGIWEKLNRTFGAGKLLPIEREEEIMMDHSYDGIVELDNHMPPWLKYTFYITIASAIFYMGHYLVFETGMNQLEEYEEELAVAQKMMEERQVAAGGSGTSVDENNVAFITDEAILEGAKTIYLRNCAACHKKDGGGSVGPNLTDEYWIHGGSINDVFKVIKYGVQEKGMIPWKDQLSAEEIQGLASYLITLEGTNPENAKDPQGDKFEREAEIQEEESLEISSL